MNAAAFSATPAGRSRIVTPEEVQALRELIASHIEAATKVGAMPDDIRAGWTAFTRGWARVCSDAPSWSLAPAQLKEAEEQGRLLRMWLSLLAANYAGKPQETNGIRQVNWLPNVIYPSDVIAIKNRLDSSVVGWDNKVRSCKELPDDVREKWQRDSKTWRDFFNEDVGIWHLGGQMDHAEIWERDLLTWQKTFDAYPCMRTKQAGGVPRLGVQLNEPFDDPDAPPPSPPAWAGTVTTVAIAGVLIAAIGLASRYSPKGS